MKKIIQKTTIDWKNQNIIIETWLKENYLPVSDSKIIISELLADFSFKTQLKLQGKNALIAQIIKSAQTLWPDIKIIIKISKPKYIPNSTSILTLLIGLKKK
jgi:hypothetical protein